MRNEEKAYIVQDYMARNGGVVDPAGLLAEFEDPEHPAHGQVDWNDGTAAHSFRLVQIRNFISIGRVAMRSSVQTSGPLTAAPIDIVPVNEPEERMVPISVSRRNGHYVDTRTPEGIQILARETANSIRSNVLGRASAILSPEERAAFSAAAARLDELVALPYEEIRDRYLAEPERELSAAEPAAASGDGLNAAL